MSNEVEPAVIENCQETSAHYSNWLFGLGKFIGSILALAIFGSILGYFLVGMPAIQTMAAMKSGLQADFNDFKTGFETSSEPFSPLLVYSGSTSKIVAASSPKEALIKADDSKFGYITQGFEMRVLARTDKGRYFHFSYVAEKTISGFACTDRDCRRIVDVRQLSDEDAKKLFFYSSMFSPEKYKEIFNEDAPVKEIPA